MNVTEKMITATDLLLVPINADRIRALVTMDTWETVLTAIIVVQVTF